MSKVSANHPQNPSAAIAPNRVPHSGWLENIVGLVVFAIVGLGVSAPLILRRLGLDPVVSGLIFTALSGIAGIAGFTTIPVMVAAGMR